jgi:hypothetical protein
VGPAGLPNEPVAATALRYFAENKCIINVLDVDVLLFYLSFLLSDKSSILNFDKIYKIKY